MPLVCDLSELKKVSEYASDEYKNTSTKLSEFIDAKTFLKSVSQDSYVEDGETEIVTYKEGLDYSFEIKILKKLEEFFEAIKCTSDEDEIFNLYNKLVSNVSYLYEQKYEER
jgi:hypothetical protein